MSNPNSDEQINSFIEFTAGSRKDAIDYLNATSNNLEQAVEMYFSGGLQNPQFNAGLTSYDESAFSQDRYGDYAASSNIPAFQIDAADDTGLNYNQSTAPTRPPSRVSHRSMDSAVNMGVPSSGRNSRMDMDISGQESGVVGNSAPYFGPATKQHYDTNQWALTVSGPTVSETIPDVDVAYRKREENEIAFLKPLPSGDYLPSLITILSAIPLVRNAFLMDSILSTDYGHDANWWSGSSIPPSGPVLVDMEASSRADLDIIHETQRLTAFLDLTYRSYGSVESLARLEALEKAPEYAGGTDTRSLLSKFLVGWEAAALTTSPDGTVPKLLHSMIEGHNTASAAWCIETGVGSGTTVKPSTLYDVLDEIIFGDDPEDEEFTLPSISKPAKTIVLKLEQPNDYLKGLDIDVPESLYIDRYLKENLSITAPMRRDIATCKEQIRQIGLLEEEIRTYSHSTSNKTFNPLELLETAMRAFRKPTDLEREVFSEHQTGDEGRNWDVLEELQSIHRRIQAKINDLKIQKENALKALQEASDILKHPSVDPELSPKRRYRLRGICTEPNVTYVLHNASEPLGEHIQQDQWWRLEYAHSNATSPHISKDKVTLDRVLTAVNEESRQVLLVYASQEAVEAELISIPYELMEFVRKDNEAFKEELDTISDTGTWDDTKSSRPIADWDYVSVPTDYNPSTYKKHDWSNVGGFVDYRATEAEATPADTEMIEMRENKGSGGFIPLNSKSQASARDVEMDDVAESIEVDVPQHVEHASTGVKREAAQIN